MKERVQGCVTAGVALVGAGVMAVSPVTPQAPEVLKAQVALAASAYDQTVPELFALSAQRTVTGLAGTPLGLAAAAIALAQGQDAAALALLDEIVDGPLWAADPAIYAFDDLLPEPIGGDDLNDPTTPDEDSAISQFRANVLYQAREDVKEALADTLGVGTASQPAGNEVSAVYAAARLAGGFADSAVRTAGSVALAPLGLVAVVEGLQKSLASGDNTDLYLALQAYIDGPNYALDPIVFAVDDVLPQPVGGDTSTTPSQMTGSAVSDFRADVLLAPRDRIREAVAAPLGVDPVTGADVQTTEIDATLRSAQRTSDVEESAAPKQERPTKRFLSSLKENAEEASERAQERRAERSETRAKHRAETKKALGGLRKAVRDAVSPSKPKADSATSAE
jgi:hypothetical protein